MWKEIIDSKEAILFDLDGTLIDSMWIWKQIDIDYFKMFGLDFPPDYQKEIEGRSFYETAVLTKEKYNIPQSVEEMMKTWSKMAYDKYEHEVVLKKGVLELLEYASSHNIKLGIATSNSCDLCMAALKSLDIIRFFDVILTGDEIIKGKPEPDVYLAVADKLKVNYEKCIVFEDLEKGIEAGNNASMTTVAIWDEYSKDNWDKKVEKANYSIMDYEEIVNEIC